jgi:alpha-tubulin suppressor-like RCC1 family protein
VAVAQRPPAAVTDTGKLIGWGQAGTFCNQAPATKAGTFISSVSAGVAHIVAVANGNVLQWGGLGLVGVPVARAPQDLRTGGMVAQVAAGQGFSMALTKAGAVVVWGETPGKACGVSKVPTSVSGSGSAIAIAAGTDYALAVTNKKAIVAWGCLAFGTATDIPSTATGVTTEVSAGGTVVMARTASSKLVVFGKEYNDLLKRFKVDAPKLAGLTIPAADAGFQHMIALDSNNKLWQWAATTYDGGAPPSLPAGRKWAPVLSAGDDFSLAITVPA